MCGIPESWRAKYKAVVEIALCRAWLGIHQKGAIEASAEYSPREWQKMCSPCEQNPVLENSLLSDDKDD